MAFATKELVARTMFVPPSRFGPPESPKQVPPLLECSLRNSPLIELLLATRVVAAKNLVVESPADSCSWDRRAATVDEVLNAVPDDVDLGVHRQGVHQALCGQGAVPAECGGGGHRPAQVGADGAGG